MDNNTATCKSTSAIGPGLRLSLMGSEGSGKTCFFAGLAWLGGASNESDFGIVGRDEPSQGFVNELRNTIARHELPQSTHKTDALALDILYRGSRIGIDIEDFAGEEFRDVGTGLKSDSPIFGKLRESRYLVLFLDIENDVERADQADAERLDAVLNLLSTEKICDGSRKLAIVLSKSDLRGFVGPKATSDAARAHLKKHQPGLFKKIEGLGYEKRYFFLASIGRPSMSESELPAPFGYEALFGWLVDDLRNERIIDLIRRHWIPLVSTLAAVLLVAGVGAGIGISRHRAGNTLTDPNATNKQKQTALGNAPQGKADSYIDTKIGEIREKVDTEDSLDGLKDLQEEASKLKGHGSQPAEQMIDKLLGDLREKREDLHLVRIQALEDQKDKCRNAIYDYYLDTNATRRRESEVKKVSARLDSAERNRKRADIREANVVAGKPETLKVRCDLVAAFPFPDTATKKEAYRAVAIGRMFMANSPYHLEIKSANGLPSAHQTRLVLSNLGPSSMNEVKTKLVKSRNPQWNEPVKGFKWKPGDRLKIVWWWKSQVPMTPPTEIGTREFDAPWTSLLDILGDVELTPVTGAGHARLNGNTPKVTITCDLFPNPQQDLEAFQKFIAPGTYWQ